MIHIVLLCQIEMQCMCMLLLCDSLCGLYWSKYLNPGIIGTLARVLVPRPSVEGKLDLSGAGGVKHWVTLGNVNVHELRGTSRQPGIKDLERQVVTWKVKKGKLVK